MTKFYINFRHGNEIAKDDEGIDLPSLADARQVAFTSARELVAENIKEASNTPLEAVIITDENGKELMTIPARDVLPEPLK